VEIFPVGAEVFHVDERTDLTERHEESNICFSQFCEST